MHAYAHGRAGAGAQLACCLTPFPPAEIPDNNVGFKLLQKAGWSKGKGLGKNEDGGCGGAGVRCVRLRVDVGVRVVRG